MGDPIVKASHSSLRQTLCGGKAPVAAPSFITSIPQSSGPWRAISLVSFPPGHHEELSQSQTTDALYLIVTGRGTLVLNGDPCPGEAGVMLGAPAGATLAITNTSASENLVVFVAEVAIPDNAPSYPPSYCHVLRELHPSNHFHPAFRGSQHLRPPMATVHLHHAFAGPWGTLSLVELAPGCRVAPYHEPDQDQVLVAMRGNAEFTLFDPDNNASLLRFGAADEAVRPERKKLFHQNIFIPRGVSCSFLNLPSSRVPLLMACLTVCRPRERFEGTAQAEVE